MKAKFIFSLVLFFVFIVLVTSLWLPQTITRKAPSPLKTTPLSIFKRLFEKKESIVLVAVGDVMLGRSVNAKMRSLNDFTYPFQKTASFLKSADLAFINLESPFYDYCPTTNEGMKFCADPRAIEGLVLAGVDIVNLANNHIRNYGTEGVSLTQNLLQENKIDFLGLNNNLVIKTTKETKFGFLGFDLTSGYQEEKILEQVKKARPRVDILIVSFHWGIEYAKEPTTRQVELAHQVVEAGTDLILGHHPHVIQKAEDYKGAKIVYSLGNFIFDQPWSEKTKKGLVGIFTFEDKKLIKSEFKEVYIQNFCQPIIQNAVGP